MGTYCKGKSKPLNIALYNKIKLMVKRKVKRWPSAYASAQLVRLYKQKGGKYRCSSFGGGLDRWFKERWVDVCTGKPCGRKGNEKRRYPYCRPSRKVSSKTPRFKISRAELKRRCAIKHRIKGKRISAFGKSYTIKLKNKQNPVKKSYTINLKNKQSLLSFKKFINKTQPKDCLNWENCKSWTYLISKRMGHWSEINFRLVRKPHTINKKPSNFYKNYLSKCEKTDAGTFFSPSSYVNVAIPCKPYVNLNDFAFNSSDEEWVNFWGKTVFMAMFNIFASQGGQCYVFSDENPEVNYFHVVLRNKLNKKI
jgi:hypothetical protein